MHDFTYSLETCRVHRFEPTSFATRVAGRGDELRENNLKLYNVFFLLLCLLHCAILARNEARVRRRPNEYHVRNHLRNAFLVLGKVRLTKRNRKPNFVVEYLHVNGRCSLVK